MRVLSSLTRVEKWLLAVSGAIALAIFLVTDPVVFSVDSNAYLRYAAAISKFTVDPNTYSRQAGYPLLLVATLYPWILSVIPVLAVQAACATLTPWLIYKTLHFVSPRVALCGAWFSLATLLPYNFQTYLFPDPIQVFLSILFCYAVVSYIFKRTTRAMSGMFLVYLAVSFFRPPFLLFYLVAAAAVATVAAQDRKNVMVYVKPLVALTVLVGSAHVFASALDSYLYRRIGVERRTLAGKMIFLNAFTGSIGVDGAFADGEHTTVFREKLVEFFRDAPAKLRNLETIGGPEFARQFGPYESDPERLVTAILNTRNHVIWGVLFNVSENWFGNRAGDRLFMEVALEQYRRHPKILLNVISTGLTFYLGIRACEPPVGSFIEEYRCLFQPAFYPLVYETFGDPHYTIITGMRPHTFHRINPVLLRKLIAPFSVFALTSWPHIYRVVFATVSLFTALGLAYVGYRVLSRTGLRDLQGDLTVFVAVLSVFAIYSIPMFMLTDPQFRYVSAGVLLLVMSGAIALRVLVVGLFPSRASEWRLQ